MLFLNYKPVLTQPTGIGIYANSILPAFDQFEHVLFTGSGSGSGLDRLKRFVWSQSNLPRLASKCKASLIFTPAPEGYLGEQVISQIVMVHDLRPLSHPEYSLQSLYFRSWVPPLLRQCRHILTNSNFTALEICRSIGVPQEKITVTPLGYEADHFYPSEAKKRLHDRPYLLHIGQAYPHKNLERLIWAFHAITDQFPEVDLILLGKPHPTETKRLCQLIDEIGMSKRIVLKNYVPYADLPDWYRGAIAFVYPSLWEGFGLPIIEAMACGCPVITSIGSGSEEVSGNSAILVDPLSIPQLTEAIKHCITSPQENLIKRALYRASTYSWNNTRNGISSVINSLLTC